MQISYKLYSIVTSTLSPLISLWLRYRLLKGRENKARFRERFGFSSVAKPKGILVWFHAASVGEVNSILPFIEHLQAEFTDINILLTTGTVTSAALVEKRAPKNIIHQFAPIDTPEATNRFLRHFRPDIGFFVESELWPNLVMNAKARGCFMIIINGRMSLASYNAWQKYALRMIYDMLNNFHLVFAQSEDDMQRFRALGARDVRCVGNLKYDVPQLTCNEEELFSLQQSIGTRPAWLAASTHGGEEEQLAKTHLILAAKYPDLLTIIVPRHLQRGEEIAKQLSAHGNVSLRSRNDKITDETKFYIADTLGELGLFYRLSEIVFMGGSLIEHGGQNPLEPARLRCSILTGAHTENFADIYAEMEKNNICVRAQNPSELASQIDKLLQSSDARTQMQMNTKEWLLKKSGTTSRIMDIIAPIFEPVGKT